MSWEEVKHILRPDLNKVHMGVLKVDPDVCTQCGLCIENCPFKAWEPDENGIPRLKEGHACFSCYNCMVACPSDAIQIVQPYYVEEGFWVTRPNRLPEKLPLTPEDADGNRDDWNVIERAVLTRRSVRNFKDKPVPDSLIRRVLEAGRFAPSGGNCQPWSFTVVTDKDLLKEIDEAVSDEIKGLYGMYRDDQMVRELEALIGDGKVGIFDPRQILGGSGTIATNTMGPLLNAPALIIISGDTRAIGGPELNVGICGQNMNLVANSLGIKACWIGFIRVLNMRDDIKNKLGIVEPWEITSSLVLGYPKFKQEGIVPREYRPVRWFRDGSEVQEIED